MTKNYQYLESKMVTYKDLLAIPVIENNDPFVILPETKIQNAYVSGMNDMVNVLGKKMVVRKSVYEKLLNAQKNLQEKYPQLSVFVTYGYRSLEIQTARFLQRLKDTDITFYRDSVELYEAIHRSIAVPTVAGHPTGGAIDITLIDQSGKFLDFGTKQYDYTTKDYYVFSTTISKTAKTNRMILRSIMINAGFAPFDGEWWHFSYGDKEWAYYYKNAFALYEQTPFNSIKKVYNKGVL